MITWKNVAAFDPSKLLEASSKATDKFVGSIKEAGKILDPTKRQDEMIEREGKASLRESITDIQTLEGVGAARAAEEGYGDAALQASNPMMTEEQRKTVGEALQTRLGTARTEAIDQALAKGGDVADKTRSISEGRRTMIEDLRAAGMGEANIEQAVLGLDKSGTRQAEYDLAEKADLQTLFDTTAITENLSGQDLRKVIAENYQGKNPEQAYNELVTRRDQARTDSKWTEAQLKESTLDDAQALYHESGDVDTAIQHLKDSGIKDDLGAITEMRQYAAAVEKFDKKDEVEFSEISSRADEQVTSELGLVKSHLDGMQASYDTQIQATSEEIEAERKRAIGGPGIVQLLNQPAENKGWFQRLINVDIQFNDDAALALGDQLEKAVAAGVPAETASVFLRKAVYKDYGHHQAIGKGVGVDPLVLNKAMNEFTQNYLAAEKDREQLITNNQAYTTLERELKSSARSYKNAYATGMAQTKSTGKRSNLDRIQREWDTKLNRAVAPGDVADMKDLVGEKPTTEDIIERNIRNINRAAKRAQ